MGPVFFSFFRLGVLVLCVVFLLCSEKLSLRVPVFNSSKKPSKFRFDVDVISHKVKRTKAWINRRGLVNPRKKCECSDQKFGVTGDSWKRGLWSRFRWQLIGTNWRHVTRCQRLGNKIDGRYTASFPDFSLYWTWQRGRVMQLRNFGCKPLYSRIRNRSPLSNALKNYSHLHAHFGLFRLSNSK